MSRRAKGGWALLTAAVLVAGLGLAPVLAAGTDGKWLHVRVLDKGAGGESVRVNLPIAILETMAEAIEADHFKEGHIQLGDKGLDAEKLRSMWQSVRNTRDMEFVTVESTSETVRVAKDRGFLVIKVDGDDEGTVDVKVPIEVVDALLQAPEGRLNVKAAIQALVHHGTGDLVQVKDGSSTVRIWIDDRSTTDV